MNMNNLIQGKIMVMEAETEFREMVSHRDNPRSPEEQNI